MKDTQSNVMGSSRCVIIEVQTVDLCACVCGCVQSASNKHDNLRVNQFLEAGWPYSLAEHRRASASRVEQGRPVQEEDESTLITKASNCPPQPRTPTSALNSNYGENTVHCHPILSCWRAGRVNQWTLWLWRGGGGGEEQREWRKVWCPWRSVGASSTPSPPGSWEHRWEGPGMIAEQ